MTREQCVIGAALEEARDTEIRSAMRHLANAAALADESARVHELDDSSAAILWYLVRTIDHHHVGGDHVSNTGEYVDLVERARQWAGAARRVWSNALTAR